MAELDARFQRIWSQTRVPVILRQGTGRPLYVRVPYAADNRTWLRGDSRHQPKWITDKKWWETPQAWFNRLIDQALERYGEVYVIQLYKEQQKCAPACWNAKATTASVRAWVPITATAILVADGMTSPTPSPSSGGRRSSRVGTWYSLRAGLGSGSVCARALT
jgi:hypothetical protein